VKRRPALQRNASSGSLPIDNNPVENVIQPSAIGKKNWQFGGSERAGYRAAASQNVFAAPTERPRSRMPAGRLPRQAPNVPNSQIDLLLPFANFTQP
jgi:hypothetical protein